MWKIASIGECMLEISNPTGEVLKRKMAVQFSFGGDTLNTAIYLARLGVPSAFVTALGDDPYSEWLLSEWGLEDVQTDMVLRLENRNPGLYMIETDSSGERSFHYWRKQAPIRELFDDDEKTEAIFSQLKNFDLVYLSGITLSLFDEVARNKLFNGIENLYKQGVRIAFDGNYRPAGWETSEQAKAAFEKICSMASIVLPTFDDEVSLFGDKTPQETLDRIHAYGVEEIAVKLGAKGVIISSVEQKQLVVTTAIKNVIDSTAAGDSFNAGYIGARAQGLSSIDAAIIGNQLAGCVIQYPGAIISKEVMPKYNFLNVNG